MKTLLFATNYPCTQAPARDMDPISVFGALARHGEVRLVAPRPWWTLLRHHARGISNPLAPEADITAAFPLYWSLPARYETRGDAIYRSLRHSIKRLRQSFPFDVILAGAAYPDAYAAARLARELGCPLVTGMGHSDLDACKEFPQLLVPIRQALGQSHRVIAHTAAVREGVLELGVAPDKVLVQSYGVDSETFRLQDQCEARRRLGLPRNSAILLYIGNYTSDDGVDVLIEAVVRLKGRGRSEVFLALVGSGPQEAALRALVKKYHLADQVRFCGRLLHTEVPDWMAASDLLCSPRLRGECSSEILEALSCGRPVVVSQLDGVQELLNESSGRTAPPGDPDALADALANALDTHWSADALRASVADRTWESVGKGYYAALASALGIPSRSPAAGRRPSKT